MRTTTALLAAVVVSLQSPSSAAPAAAQSGSTMEQCAKLLPPGRRYTFGINGTIDYSGAQPVLHGELTVANDANEDLTNQASSFAQCFAKLVR